MSLPYACRSSIILLLATAAELLIGALLLLHKRLFLTSLMTLTKVTLSHFRHLPRRSLCIHANRDHPFDSRVHAAEPFL